MPMATAAAMVRHELSAWTSTVGAPSMTAFIRAAATTVAAAMTNPSE